MRQDNRMSNPAVASRFFGATASRSSLAGGRRADNEIEDRRVRLKGRWEQPDYFPDSSTNRTSSPTRISPSSMTLAHSPPCPRMAL